jgi:hypothetical protein
MHDSIKFLLFLFFLLILILLYFLIWYQFGISLFCLLFLYSSWLFFLIFSNLLHILITHLPYRIKNSQLKYQFEWLKAITNEIVAYLIFGFKRATVTDQLFKKVFINKRIDVILNENQLVIFNDCFIYIFATFLCISFQKLFIKEITSNECEQDFICINKLLRLCNTSINTTQSIDSIEEFVCFKFDSNQFVYNIAIIYSFYKLYTTGAQLVFMLFYSLSQSYKSVRLHLILPVTCLIVISFFKFLYSKKAIDFLFFFFLSSTNNDADNFGNISFVFFIDNIFHFMNVILYFLTFVKIIYIAEKISKNSIYIKNEMHLPLIHKISILSKEQSENLLKICKYKSFDNCKLLYKATIDGFSSKIFHKKCDHFKNTLTIVKSINGNVFGGYTTQSWTPEKYKYYKADKNAFIFSLENRHNKPFKIKCKSDKYAIYCNREYGPVFGCVTVENNLNRSLQCELSFVSDILLDLDKNNSNEFNSSTKVSHCYSNQYVEDLIQQNQTNVNYLSGSLNFQILDIEVYWIKNELCSCC